MGHGEVIVLCDAHYEVDMAPFGPSLSVPELDSFVERPAGHMMVDNEPNTMPNVQMEARHDINAVAGKPMQFGVVPRKKFRARARGYQPL
jgi:L-fucose mutarotase/ribose pyranase (RbsD/FucU family)